ncbi:ORF6N domain-containing protein [Salmonella enterica]|nr:ORF6N domain-containing protein [Salmonella enterica subsp. enterica serovar Edinburgh]EBH8904420.1 ORF6N domain-containing protein [Salmonella enterica subsp. enterica serovar 6,7:b:-]EJA4992592.1 ORF6N domain-containing protein [Salmonella enterica]EBH8946508.1 ORF6N domain-containing protein [Salmonella enterica subsp. enterica serovar 6,7:b:-]EJA5011293.1 ORF6N domain-containing protein [Salmonella enterica]
MTTQIAVETLSPILHNQIPVVTTELLAILYGTDPHSITKNHRSNVDRFVAGKHFFKLEGADLKAFKNKVTDSDLVASRAKHLILWTERGAARHAKMLETDQAWEVFEKLEDCYFNQKQPVSARQSHPAIPFPKERRFIVTVSPDGTADTQPLPDDVFIGKVSSILSDLRQMGWIVIKRDLLAETLATW